MIIWPNRLALRNCWRVSNLIAQRRRLQELFQSQNTGARRRDRNLDGSTIFAKAIDIIEAHISDTDFTAEIFSSEMSVSRVHLEPQN